METEKIISDTAARCAGSPIAVYGGEQFFASLSRAAEGTGIALSRGEGCAAIVEEGEECPPELPCIVVPPREGDLAREQFAGMLKDLLFAFPVAAIDVVVPGWVRSLPADNSAVSELIERVLSRSREVKSMSDCAALASALEGAGLDAFSIDPTEEHDELGYYVAADILDATGEKTGSYIRVDVDNTGTVVEVSYTLAVDPAASLEDNLAHAEAELTTMHAPLTALDIPAHADGMLTYGALPEAFRQAFLAGSMYESIGLQYYELDDAGIVDGAEVNCYYFTDTEEDWDEHTEPRIYLVLEASD